MANPTEQQINEAHSSIDWSPSMCGQKARKDPAVALLFDEPDLHPERANLAKKLCIQCPILGECLIYALRYETPLDVQSSYLPADNLMGGFSRRERTKMKQSAWWAEYYGDAS